MEPKIKQLFGVVALTLFLVADISSAPLQASKQAPDSVVSTELFGRWNVKFKLMGLEKNFVLDARSGGSANFLLLDTGPNDQPVKDALAGAWSKLTNDRVSFSGEAELPIGTCCRELGTMVFKGTFGPANTLSGTMIFITSISEEESPYRFHTVIGTFTASRIVQPA